jgi:hypothetical protein
MREVGAFGAKSRLEALLHRMGDEGDNIVTERDELIAWTVSNRSEVTRKNADPAAERNVSLLGIGQ